MVNLHDRYISADLFHTYQVTTKKVLLLDQVENTQRKGSFTKMKYF